MIRKNVHLKPEQINFIGTLSGTFAEHIRIALDDYIQKQKNLNVSASSSNERRATWNK
jgi:hypothetical protein